MRGEQSSDVFTADTRNGSHEQSLLVQQGVTDFFSFRKHFGWPRTVAVGAVDSTSETKIFGCASRKRRVELHDFIVLGSFREQ